MDLETLRDIVSDALDTHGDKLGIDPESPDLSQTELDIASSIMEELDKDKK